MVQLIDKLTLIDGARKSGDGYMRAVAKAARPGIQQYLGREVDPSGTKFARDAVVNVYRPESEVFDSASMASFIHRPVTDDHPSVPVNAKNWRDHGRGFVSRVKDEDGWLNMDLAFMDGDLIAKVDAGKRELSCGYSCDLAIEDGVTPEGEPYQAIQRNIRANHVAVVDAARAGPEARISDASSDGGNARFAACDAVPTEIHATDREKPVKTILVDSLQVEVTDAAEAAIRKLEGKIADGAKALTDAQSEHDKAMATKDAEIEKLQGQVVDEATIDARAAAKVAVLDQARKVLGDKAPDFAGKSVTEIRRMACDAKGVKVEGKSDDYVEARFDALTADTAPASQTVITTPIVAADASSIRDAAKRARFAN